VGSRWWDVGWNEGVGGSVYTEWESEEEPWVLLRYKALHPVAPAMNIGFRLLIARIERGATS